LRRSMHYTQSKKVYISSAAASEQKASASADENPRKALAGAGRGK